MRIDFLFDSGAPVGRRPRESDAARGRIFGGKLRRIEKKRPSVVQRPSFL